MDDTTLHTGLSGRHAAGDDGHPDVSPRSSILQAPERNTRVLKLKSKLRVMEEKEAKKRTKVIEEEWAAMGQEYETLLSSHRHRALVYENQIAKLEGHLVESRQKGCERQAGLSELQARYDTLFTTQAKCASNAKTIACQVSLLSRQKASAEGELEEEKQKGAELIARLEIERRTSTNTIQRLEEELKKEKARRRKAEKNLAESTILPKSINKDLKSTPLNADMVRANVTTEASARGAPTLSIADLAILQDFNDINHKRKHDELSQSQDARSRSLPMGSIEARSFRTKQTARKSTGGRAPRRQLAVTKISEKSEEKGKVQISREQRGSTRETKTALNHPSRGDEHAGKSNPRIAHGRTTFTESESYLEELFGEPEREDWNVPKMKKRKLDVLAQA